MDDLDALLKELNNPRSSYFPSNPTNSTILTGNILNNDNYNDSVNNMRNQEPTPEQSPMHSKQNMQKQQSYSSNQQNMKYNNDYSSDEDNERDLNSIMAGLNMISPKSKSRQPNQGYKYNQDNNSKKINGPRDAVNGMNGKPNMNYMNDSNDMENEMNMKNKKNVNNASEASDVNNDYKEKEINGDAVAKSNNQKQPRKIMCATCKNQIKGKVVSCLGKTWHPEHFICQAGCKKLLDPNRFFEKNHLPCCENCHRESFIPRCAYCGDVITEKCITALGTTWHTDHFFCCQCAVQFPAGSGFLEKDGKAYCERDYYRLFATRCGKCGEVIVGEYISALNKEWHNKCFTCKECNCSFPSESFFEYKGMPYCEIHYHLKRGSLCLRCNKPIVGRCISASGKKYHPEHFTCIQCNKILETGNEDDEYKEINGNPFCGQCASNLSL